MAPVGRGPSWTGAVPIFYGAASAG